MIQYKYLVFIGVLVAVRSGITLYARYSVLFLPKLANHCL